MLTLDPALTNKRWLRIIPVAVVMYTISYIDRTNVSLALDPEISTMMPELGMDDRMKGQAAGIFFLGYMLLQIPGGYWAERWSPRKLISIFLVAWGAFAAGCGLAQTYRQFEVLRFLLGVAESGVFPATLVLLANWFPKAERARANAYWTLCQPLAIAGTAPFTAWLLGAYGWQKMLIVEGLLPLAWLPVWWLVIRDHPREASWLTEEEKVAVEAALRREAEESRIAGRSSWKRVLVHPVVLLMIGMYFLQNCAAYGCMTFFTSNLKGRGFSTLDYGVLFAIPYAVTAVLMVVNSRHSDRAQERRGHVAAAYVLSGLGLMGAVATQQNFWVSYLFMCLAIPGPFAALGPFWSIPSETLPRALLGVLIGLVNAFGNLGGYFGPYAIGWLKQETGDVRLPFAMLGAGMLLAAALAFLLPANRTEARPRSTA